MTSDEEDLVQNVLKAASPVAADNGASRGRRTMLALARRALRFYRLYAVVIVVAGFGTLVFNWSVADSHGYVAAIYTNAAGEANAEMAMVLSAVPGALLNFAVLVTRLVSE